MQKHNHNKNKTMGQKIADRVAAGVGSWYFICIQSTILIFWIVVNTINPQGIAWDPPSFVLLNLLLSFQAAYTAPIIMMSQNRQNQIDRQRAVADYHVNTLAEKEITSLQKGLEEIKAKLDKLG
jgi:uncharacterized membrane protein